MSTPAVAKLPRPKNLNNIHHRYMLGHLAKATGWAFVVGAIYYRWIQYKHKKIEEYFATYDPYAEFERMRNLGLFSSCPPDNVDEL